MTRPDSLPLAPRRWTSLAARLLPILLALLLLGGSAAGASVPSDNVEPEASAAVEPDSEERAVAEANPFALGGRSRFEMSLGVSDIYVSDNDRTDAVDVSGAAFSLVFLHWIDEHFAFELALGAHNVGVSSRPTIGGEIVHADGFGGLLAGGRFYLPVVGAFRPHVGLALGPLTELQVYDRPWQTDVTLRTTKLGFGAEAGIDLLFGRHFVVGIQGGVILRDGYHPYRRVGLNLGWAFGRAR